MEATYKRRLIVNQILLSYENKRTDGTDNYVVNNLSQCMLSSDTRFRV